MTVLTNVTEAITLMTGTVLPDMLAIVLQPPFVYGVGIAMIVAGVGLVKWLMRIR